MSTTRNLFNRALSNLQLGIPSSQPADPDAVDFVNTSEYVSEEMDAAGIGLIHKLTIGEAEGTIDITENGTHQVGGYLYADVQVAEPTGTIEITENGTYNVSDYASADVDVPQGVFPEGTINITENGTVNVSEYESAAVNVPVPDIQSSKTVTTNGTVLPDSGYDALAKVIVNVPSDTPTIVSKSITSNGTYNAAADNADGYSPVTVNVPVPTVQSSKLAVQNGTVLPDAGYDAMAKVVVNVPSVVPTIVSKNITQNGTYNASSEGADGYSPVTVSVPVPTLQASKTVTANGTVTPDAGFDALEKVVVNVPTPQPVIVSKSITANGTYNASSDSADGYSPVVVNVPGPSGSQTFTQNGTYDVTSIAQAIINVSGGTSFPVPYVTFTPEADIAGDETITLTHSLGYTPFLVVVFAIQRSTTSPTFQIMNVTSPATVLTATNNSGTLRYVSSSISITKTSTGISISTTSGSYYWRKGVTYYVMLIGQDVPLMMTPSPGGEEIERT